MAAYWADYCLQALPVAVVYFCVCVGRPGYEAIVAALALQFRSRYGWSHSQTVQSNGLIPRQLSVMISCMPKLVAEVPSVILCEYLRSYCPSTL